VSGSGQVRAYRPYGLRQQKVHQVGRNTRQDDQNSRNQALEELRAGRMPTRWAWKSREAVQKRAAKRQFLSFSGGMSGAWAGPHCR